MKQNFDFRRSEFGTIFFVVIFALIIRILLIICLKTYDIPNNGNHWSFGYETGRVARAIANGDGFCSPFEIGNTPTAWVAPVYSYILALVFKVFGIYSQGSAFTILFLNSLFSSLTCFSIYYISKNTINEKVGFLSSILFAIYPPAIWHSINTVWNTTLSTLLISVLVLFAILSVKKPGYLRAIIFGGFSGLTALTNPTVIAFLPLCIFWLYVKMKVSVKNVYIYTGIVAFSFLITISPWLMRNYTEFSKFIFIKSNFGFELRLGNNPNANGTFSMKKGEALHPTLSKKEMNLFNELNEVEYVKYSSKKAKDYIYNNPGNVLFLTVKRFYLFWFGDLLNKNNWTGNIHGIVKVSVLKEIFYLLPIPFFLYGIVSAWRRKIGISLLVYLLMSYPLVYYFTHVSNRYRHPVEPVILIIGTFGIIVLYEKIKIYAQTLS